nr:MAG TPA: hypothetical protein [Caudoviricetes sp.]
MTIEETKERIAVMQAYVDGKQIEGECSDGKWVYVPEPSWSINGNFRIKPEPKYRPFKDADECWQEMLKHEPFGWIKRRGCYVNIVAVTDVYAYLSEADGSAILLASKNSYNDNTFADGTPFGVKEGV